MEKLIRTLTIPEPLDWLVAGMRRLYRLNDGRWRAPSGEVLSFTPTMGSLTPGRATWEVGVLPLPETGWRPVAAVEAYEVPGGTAMDFVDNWQPGALIEFERLAIGPAFAAFAAFVGNDLCARHERDRSY